MAKKNTSPNQKAKYKEYKVGAKFIKNRKAKLERHLKKFPNDEQAKTALRRNIEYRRKKPNNSNTWSKPAKEYARLLASVGINGNFALRKKTSGPARIVTKEDA